jgi:hypothetical protein
VASESYAADILAVTSIGLTSSFTIFFVYLPPLFDRLSLVVSSFIDIERLDGFLKWTAWKSYPLVKANGTVTCQTDTNSGGTVTSVGSGLGLAGGPITKSGTKVALLGSPCADTIGVTTRTKSTDRMSKR